MPIKINHKTYKAIIFDVDDTLIDTTKSYDVAIKKTVKKFTTVDVNDEHLNLVRTKGLLYGVNNSRNINAAKGQLHAMLKVREPQIKKPHCKYGATFAIKDSKKHEIGTFKYNHDAKLRNCLAKFMYDRNYKGMEDLTTRWDDKDADGQLEDLYFELDNGGMDDRQPTDKLAKHYISRGKFRVVFFMVASTIFPIWKKIG